MNDKLYKVELILRPKFSGFKDGQYDFNFDIVEKNKKNYKFRNDGFPRWETIYYSLDVLPKDIKVWDTTHYGVMAVQGFDKKPTDKELETIKEKMKMKLFEKVQNDYLREHKTFMNRLKALSEME